jgi:iron(III) transport system permease protein
MERARPRLRWLLWIALLAPLAFPAPVVGLGLIGMWNWTPAFRPHGTVIMPVLAALARFLPLAALILGAHLRRVDPLLFDAARVHQTSAAKTLSFVSLPLLLPGVLAASFCVFVMTAGELGATLMVTPPGYQTLSVRIYNYLHYGSSAVVASLCFVLMMLALAGAGAATAAAAGWMRLLRGSRSDCL